MHLQRLLARDGRMSWTACDIGRIVVEVHEFIVYLEGLQFTPGITPHRVAGARVL